MTRLIRSKLPASGAVVVIRERSTLVTNRPRVLVPPGGRSSRSYSLAAGRDGVTCLSWIEPLGKDADAIRFSTLERGAWTPARTVAIGSHSFVDRARAMLPHDQGFVAVDLDPADLEGAVPRHGFATHAPALAVLGGRVAGAWFNPAGDVAHIKVTFATSPAGRAGAPIVVSGDQPVGWPGVVLVEDGSAIVGWLERVGAGRTEIRVRRAWPDGRLGDPVVVAISSSRGSIGALQMVRGRGQLVVAWHTDRVLTAVMPVPGCDEVRS